jgi:hypothetical protein
MQGCFWEAVLGVMDRSVLSNTAWQRMAPLIKGRPDQKGSTGRDLVARGRDPHDRTRSHSCRYRLDAAVPACPSLISAI